MALVPTPTLNFDRGASLPAVKVWWPDDKPSGNSLRDFSSGWTFSGRIGLPGRVAVTTLAGGQFAGAVGSGDGYGDSDVPNLTITFTNVNAAALTVGTWQMDLVATRVADGLVMKRKVRLVIDEIVS